MSIAEIFLIALGVSMDAFAVSISVGLSNIKNRTRTAIKTGLYFGFFQAMMPVVGFFIGTAFSKYITTIDHWIAFALLGAIGVKMIVDGQKNDADEAHDVKTGRMLVLAVATSIDALAIGVGFSFIEVHIFQAAILIGITTFLLSTTGVFFGKIIGARFSERATLCGGAILIIMGLKILLEHLGFI
jgi:putative Mn2+ efflux pump MntP